MASIRPRRLWRPTGVAIICEGYTDVIMMHEAGRYNVVATLGTALTVQHIRVLSRHAKHKIVYLFDGDEAGQRAAHCAARFIDESMLPEAGRKQVDLCAVTLPDNLDPADFVVQRGGEAIQELIDNAVPLLRYAIDRKLRGRNLVDFGEAGHHEASRSSHHYIRCRRRSMRAISPIACSSM